MKFHVQEHQSTRIVLTHGGASSPVAFKDGTDLAADVAMRVLKAGESALHAAVKAASSLEDDGRFNAGRGSTFRSNTKRQQMDASCMDSGGRMAAVANLEHFRNPIEVAFSLTDTPHVVLCGEGASDFARQACFQPALSPSERVLTKASTSTDTVGAVCFDGEHFATALSTGGITNCPLGRIGDVPLPGCGFYCGPYGAVVATGYGEAITKSMLAIRCYQLLETRTPLAMIFLEAEKWLPKDTDFGLLVLNRHQYGGGAKSNMAWSCAMQD